MRKLALLLAALTALVSFSAPASAEVYHGFVVQEHYVVQGGSPIMPEQMAKRPSSVFRSEMAYVNFRAHLATFTGEPMTDAKFRQLLRSDRIRLVDCKGSIDTSGITDSGRVGTHVRDCYNSPRYGVEQLIQYRLADGRWVTVASLWCWNPVHGEVPEAIQYQAQQQYAPPPPAPVQMEKDYSAKNATSSTTRIDLPSMGSTVLVIGLGGLRHNDDCPPDQHEH